VVARVLLSFAVVLLGGCANFKAVSEFAQQTGKLTSTVQAEFQQVDALCREQAELTIAVGHVTTVAPEQDCDAAEQAQSQLASVTVDVLSAFAGALESLANDQSFDLTSDLDGVGGKLQALQDKNGTALVPQADVTALTKVVELIAYIATERKREEAVRRMVHEKDQLATTGRILRQYFVGGRSAGDAPRASAYQNRILLIQDASNTTLALLDSKAFRQAEPIRTMELSRASKTRVALLEKRGAAAQGNVASVMASAIDAWLSALDTFDDDALKPEPKALLGRLKEFRAKATAARNAVKAAAAAQ